jgi:hypothetical protein
MCIDRPANLSAAHITAHVAHRDQRAACNRKEERTILLPPLRGPVSDVNKKGNGKARGNDYA